MRSRQPSYPLSKPTTTTNGIVTLRLVGFTPGRRAGMSQSWVKLVSELALADGARDQLDAPVVGHAPDEVVHRSAERRHTPRLRSWSARGVTCSPWGPWLLRCR